MEDNPQYTQRISIIHQCNTFFLHRKKFHARVPAHIAFIYISLLFTQSALENSIGNEIQKLEKGMKYNKFFFFPFLYH